MRLSMNFIGLKINLILIVTVVSLLNLSGCCSESINKSLIKAQETFEIEANLLGDLMLANKYSKQQGVFDKFGLIFCNSFHGKKNLEIFKTGTDKDKYYFLLQRINLKDTRAIEQIINQMSFESDLFLKQKYAEVAFYFYTLNRKSANKEKVESLVQNMLATEKDFVTFAFMVFLAQAKDITITESEFTETLFVANDSNYPSIITPHDFYIISRIVYGKETIDDWTEFMEILNKLEGNSKIGLLSVLCKVNFHKHSAAETLSWLIAGQDKKCQNIVWWAKDLWKGIEIEKDKNLIWLYR
jgi:hypothetical protein